MTAIDFYKQVNEECKKNFDSTISDTELVGVVFDLTECIHEWTAVIQDKQISELLIKIIEQIEVSFMNLSYGLYRQAFSSQRLALELFLGSIYFSTHKLEYMEWLQGSYDNSWANLTDEDSGVLSSRFAKAFCPELTENVQHFNHQAKKIYRNLSEYVHGNFETFNQANPIIEKNDALINTYKSIMSEYKNIFIFILIIRYINILDIKSKSSIYSTTADLHHIDSIRKLFKFMEE